MILSLWSPTNQPTAGRWGTRPRIRRADPGAFQANGV